LGVEEAELGLFANGRTLVFECAFCVTRRSSLISFAKLGLPPARRGASVRPL
jgi:hypothetical protein